MSNPARIQFDLGEDERGPRIVEAAHLDESGRHVRNDVDIEGIPATKILSMLVQRRHPGRTVRRAFEQRPLKLAVGFAHQSSGTAAKIPRTKYAAAS